MRCLSNIVIFMAFFLGCFAVAYAENPASITGLIKQQSNGSYFLACATADKKCPVIGELLKTAEGYGKHAMGGTGGQIIIVNSGLDDGLVTDCVPYGAAVRHGAQCTLRQAINRGLNGPVWIIFDPHVESIDLNSQITIPQYVTIDGRGANVTIRNSGFLIQPSVNKATGQIIRPSNNIIITNISMDGNLCQKASDGTWNCSLIGSNNPDDADTVDAIPGIRMVGSHDVWINHVSLTNYPDKLISVVNTPNVTLSWLHMYHQDKALMINNTVASSAEEEEKEGLFADFAIKNDTSVTIHHSWFDDTVQRNPRVAYGHVHLYNNVFQNWYLFAVSFSLEAQGIIEGNIFQNSTDFLNETCRNTVWTVKEGGLEPDLCHNLSNIPKNTIWNGTADEKSFLVTDTDGRYEKRGLTYMGFLIVNDNLYTHGATANAGSYMPEKVYIPHYCYHYQTPDADLEAEVKAYAGNHDASSTEFAAKICKDVADDTE